MNILTCKIPATNVSAHRSLEEQRREFARNPFLAMPIAGTIMWTLIGIAGANLSLQFSVWVLFFGTGFIFSLGMLIARLTGEDLLGRTRPGNVFDSLFMHGVVMAWLVFAIAIPFLRADPTSLPLTVGILSGLMWIPFGWIIRHPVGMFHGVARTVLVLAAWYAFPEERFVAIPAVIVALYTVTIVVLMRRPRELPADRSTDDGLRERATQSLRGETNVRRGEYG